VSVIYLLCTSFCVHRLILAVTAVFDFWPFSLVYLDSRATGLSSMVYIHSRWVFYALHACRFVPISWYELLQLFSTFHPFWPLSLSCSDFMAAGLLSMVYIHSRWVFYALHACHFVPISWYELLQLFSTFHPFWPLSLSCSDFMATGPSSMVYSHSMRVFYSLHTCCFVPIGWYEL